MAPEKPPLDNQYVNLDWVPLSRDTLDEPVKPAPVTPPEETSEEHGVQYDP